MDQRAANGSSPVLIKEERSIPRDVSLEDSGKAMAEHTREFGGEDSLLSVEPVLCFLFTHQPRHLPFLFCLQALLTVGCGVLRTKSGNPSHSELWFPRGVLGREALCGL